MPGLAQLASTDQPAAVGPVLLAALARIAADEPPAEVVARFDSSI